MTKGIARKGFDLDLKDGLAAENRLEQALLNSKIEVKSDKRAWETGNLFIETSYRGKPSGIMSTEADFWAFEVRNNTFLLISTHRLIQLVSKAKFYGLKTNGGDFNASEGVLLPFIWVLNDQNLI